MTYYEPLKMNYETLGNSLPHLHTHLIPRYKSDGAPGRPFPLGRQDGSVPQVPEERLTAEATALRRIRGRLVSCRAGIPVVVDSSMVRPDDERRIHQALTELGIPSAPRRQRLLAALST
jgi:hypothetical protein